MIAGFTFAMHGGPNINSVEDAINQIRPLLAKDAEVAIMDISYDFVGNYGQTLRDALGCRIEGKVWLETP